MLTHCLPKPVIIAIVRGIYNNRFKCIFLKNQKRFVDILLLFQNLHKILYFLKKSCASQLKHFRNYSLQKTWMLECIASLASEYPSAINVLTGPKHYRTLQNRTFIRRLHHADIYRAGKCRFQSDLKSQGFMLTHFLQISVILSTKRETYSNQFKCAYLKNQKPFVDILILFQNLHKIWNLLEKMLSLIA